MERKQALKRIMELVEELDRLQQQHLDEASTHERFSMLDDMGAEAEVALDEEFGE
jgi:hypothetical protein